MSRWAESRPWRVELDPIQRRRVQELRQQRPRPWWPRLLGFALVGCALLAAIEGDYPLPRGKEASASSAADPLYLRPVLVQPSGEADCRTPTFVWRWPAMVASDAGAAGPTFDLILLDVELQEVGRAEGLATTVYTATGAFAEALARGACFYWCVEARYQGQRIRSALEALVFSR